FFGSTAYQTQFYNGKANFNEADAVSVTAGSTTAGINAALTPTGEISGKVTDAVTHTAVSGIEVCAATSEFIFERCAFSNSSGNYTIVGLPSASYKVEFFAS